MPRKLLSKKGQIYMRKPTPSKSTLLSPGDLQPIHLIYTSYLFATLNIYWKVHDLLKQYFLPSAMLQSNWTV